MYRGTVHFDINLLCKDPNGTNAVDFNMFSQWFYDADLCWWDLAVLPEAQVFAIRKVGRREWAALLL